MHIVSSVLRASLGISLAANAPAASAAVPAASLRHPVTRPPVTGPQLPAARPSIRGTASAHRIRNDASCVSAGHGNYAFDDSTAFKTNLSDAEYFGRTNLAAANASGTFEGYGNTVCDVETVIVGGQANTIDGGASPDASNAETSFIGSGYLNTITSYDAFIGAGYSNEVANYESFIGGGEHNQVTQMQSFVGAGASNRIDAGSAFIGSGMSNTIAVGGTYGSIIGGNRNSISAEYASVIGGFGNVANGAYAIVAGGDGDTAAGTVSFAAGYHADAAHNGSFVWSDYTSGSSTVKDSATNQFVIRASGGTYVYSNEGATAGVKLAPGSGAWANLSDRSAKTDVRPLDDASILAKVTTLPVSTWRYKTERGVRHAGPMAQDFYSAFGVGEDDRHITSLDEDGVALAAIKALSHRVDELQKENDALKTLSRDVRALREENAELEARFARR